MAYELEITLSSAKDLKNINWRYGPIRPYVVVWVDPGHKVTSRVDDEGDTSPEWNQSLIVPLVRPIEDATLFLDVVHYSSPDEDTKPLIGSAKVDLCNIVDNVGIGASVTRSLKLKRPSGRPQGKLELEIMVRDHRYRGPDPYPTPQHVEYNAPPYPYGQPAPYGNPGYEQPTYGYGQPAGYGYEQPEEKNKSGFGGMGTGLAIGAVAGVVGGIALAEGFDQLEDHIADEAAEQVEDDLGDEDDE
ncbi:protein SRC2-like [Chenopodium quinoa]|uniref:protein SRC2-like n=1 Tax=Chenopodium quinoa TaxID=63459 RepID=UPI000B78762F|nr:protein SRC2-like [Chenopodium quinoa]